MHDQGRFYSTYDLKNINIALMVQQCPCLMREQVVQFSWIFFSLASSEAEGEKLNSKAGLHSPSSPLLSRPCRESALDWKATVMASTKLG